MYLLQICAFNLILSLALGSHDHQYYPGAAVNKPLPLVKSATIII